MILPLHGAIREAEYAACVETSILTSGCTSSRASIAGACVGALGTPGAIPAEWLGLMADGAELTALADRLLELREQLQARL